MPESRVPSLLFEMLVSFVDLAETLNLSQTVLRIGSTRQTVRRHVAALEEALGAKLFEIVDRQYRLTADGETHLAEARLILSDVDGWMSGSRLTAGNMQRTHLMEIANGWLHARQHPLFDVWTAAPPLLQRGLDCWMRAKAQLEDKAMNRIRPYLVVHRRLGDRWICVEVGDKSSYATWLGWSWAKSALGSAYEADPLSSDADRYMIDVNESVHRTGTPWYDHIYARFPRAAGGEPEPVLYQRIVFSCAFPDQSRAVAALVARTNSVDIPHLAGTELPKMKPADLMEFDI